MSTIKYEIEFFSNWHCGSGLAAGADVDSLVIKDKEGLPYIPGRTIKGLFREAADLLNDNKDTLNLVFGVSGNEENHAAGTSFFSNAVLSENERRYVLEHQLQDYLFETFASTQIDENGIAKDHSLRKIQTVVPCMLEGVILNVPDGVVNMIDEAICFIKRLGTGRTRGYGRCKITIKKEA